MTRAYLAFLALVLVVGLGFKALAGDNEVSSFDKSVIRTHSSAAWIDTSAADYTGFQTLVTITPPSGVAMSDVRIVVDLDKATDGLAESSGWDTETLQLSISRKVDGTNYRVCHNLITPSTAIAADDADNRSIEIDVGTIGPGELLKLVVKVSAEAAGDVELPYLVYYRSPERAAFTDQGH